MSTSEWDTCCQGSALDSKTKQKLRPPAARLRLDRTREQRSPERTPLLCPRRVGALLGAQAHRGAPAGAARFEEWRAACPPCGQQTRASRERAGTVPRYLSSGRVADGLEGQRRVGICRWGATQPFCCTCGCMCSGTACSCSTTAPCKRQEWHRGWHAGGPRANTHTGDRDWEQRPRSTVSGAAIDHAWRRQRASAAGASQTVAWTVTGRVLANETGDSNESGGPAVVRHCDRGRAVPWILVGSTHEPPTRAGKCFHAGRASPLSLSLSGVLKFREREKGGFVPAATR